MFSTSHNKWLSSFTVLAMLAPATIAITAAIPPAPVRASGDPSITVNDGTCDLTAAALGRGSAQDPFVINTAKSLAEIVDCRARSFTITGASVNGTDVVFTSNNALGPGHSVSVTGASPADFNAANLRVIAADANSFTVRYSSPVSATWSSGGSAVVDHDHYELGADIDLSVSAAGWNDLSGTGWVPLPTTTNISLDGKNKTINGLKIDSNTSDLGLFAVLSNSNISNLRFTNVDIDQSGANSQRRLGALVADGNRLNITNVHVQGQVVASRGVAGLLAGELDDSNLDNVSSEGSLTTAHDGVASDTNTNLSVRAEEIGGLIGYTRGSNVVRANSTADVTGASTVGNNTAYAASVGALIGRHADGNISHSSASGKVVGNSYLGGLVGNFSGSGHVVSSLASGDIEAYNTATFEIRATRIGGFIGNTSGGGAIVDSSSTGDVTITSLGGSQGSDYIGGFIGSWSCCGSVEGSTSSGDLLIRNTGTGSNRNVDAVGGFIGYWNWGGYDLKNSATGAITIENSSTSGTVSRIGGYIGYMAGSGLFEDVSATGDLSITTDASAQYIGGLVGYADYSGTYRNAHSTVNITVNKASQVGGLLGFADYGSEIVDSSWNGSIVNTFDGEMKAGGLVGYVLKSLRIERSFARGSITASPATAGQSANMVGGLIGDVNASVHLTDVFARMNVTGGSLVGGLFGTTRQSNVRANRVYMAGTVTATATNPVTDAVSNGAFTDVVGTSLVDRTLAGSLSNNANFLEKTTTEMKSQPTFVAVGFDFDGDDAVWRILATVNDGYPHLLPRSRHSQATSTAPEAPAPQIIEVPATVAQCVAPAALNIRFRDGSSRLSAKARRQIRSYVSKVKSSNCTQLTMRAYYVENSPLAKKRNRVLVAALKREFWRQQYVVRLRTLIKSTKPSSIRERTVRFSVPR